ncbi:MAG: CRISPR-associated protein Crm3 [Candidatus Hydrogenedentes bacterium]|nr:CRISPR-associated protein Crm3 [Candidatus Hydrogenedentota bacterium]
MTRVQVALLPRDGFFCKDGRGWFTSASGRGHGLEWPWPSTILGAVRTAWGRAEEDRTNSTLDLSGWVTRTAPVQLGPVLALRRSHATPWSPEHIAWPAPLDAIWFEGEPMLQRLDPQPPELTTVGRDDDTAREALWRPSVTRTDKPSQLPLWWPHADMVAWLAGAEVRGPGRDALALTRRLQVRVGLRDEELTAEESALFCHDVVETLEPRAEWAIGIKACLPGKALLPTVSTLGSDARPIWLEPLPESLFKPPAELLAAFRQGSPGLRIVVVTPARFESGWLPDGLVRQGSEYRGQVAGLEVVLRAAIVPRPMHTSGWDMAAGAPKTTARMVAPGAVYFLERADRGRFYETDALELWLRAIGTRTEEGFGHVIPGVWSPARSKQ